MREIVEAIGISQGTILSILHEKLDVEKISAGWVPRLLSDENKCNRFDGQNYGIKNRIITTFTGFAPQ